MIKQFFKSLASSLRKRQIAHSNDVLDQYNIGDVKQFPDGSERVLGYSKSGVRRWLSTKEAQEAGMKTGQSSGSPPEAESVMLEEIPSEIVVDEWARYNKYLNSDNQFLYCLTYGQMEREWFAHAYELESRKEIANGNPDRIKEIEKQYNLLDNNFLALQMYKVSCLIYQILKLQPDFDYKTFLKDNGWQELVDYLQSLKLPNEMDYTQLYEEGEEQ